MQIASEVRYKDVKNRPSNLKDMRLNFDKTVVEEKAKPTKQSRAQASMISKRIWMQRVGMKVGGK